MDEEENENEQRLTISEYIEQMDAQQLEADLVLGGDAGNECTYEKGYRKRQAVFSCLTCTPAGDAGLCTACALGCHAEHEVVELWTRRGFRCDCGNEKFGLFECNLYKDKEPLNKGNVYNQNFRGLYCSCHRPFPDPDGPEQGEMLQCCICEDWFHEGHLGLSSLQQVPRDDEGEPSFEELICPSCVSRVSFLSEYQDLFVPPQEVGEEDPPPTSSDGVVEPSSSVVSKDASEIHSTVTSLDGLTNGDPSEASGSNRDPIKSTADNAAAVAKLQTSGKGSTEVSTGESSNGGVVHCKLKPSFRTGAAPLGSTNGVSTSDGVETVGGKQLQEGQAIFMGKSWRAELCRCDACLAMYSAKELSFLLDTEDTLQEYEEAVKRKREEDQMKEEATAQDFMKNLGHVEKIELLHGINDMATGVESLFTKFSQEGRTLTSADVYEFFENLQQKRRRLNQN